MPTSQEVQQAIARNLRLFRQRRDLSLEALAARSTVSRGMIVQIEQGKTNPSINTLCLLADALGESVHALVNVEHSSPVRVLTADQAVELWRGKRGSRARIVAGAGSSGPVELWEWQLRYGDAYEAPAHAHGTREMLFVIEGALLLTIDEVQYRAAAGDTLFFDADAPHRYAAADRSGTHVIMVVLEPNVGPLASRTSLLPGSAASHGRQPARRKSARRPEERSD
jgi:transcriptional regulator with XRE-family HTH domain